MGAVGPLVTFTKFLIAASAAAWSNWEVIESQWDRVEEHASASIFGMHVHCVFEMKDGGGGFGSGNRGMFGIHLMNTTGGNLDETWDQADFDAAVNAVRTPWLQRIGTIPDTFRLTELRFYPFGPGVVKPNPPAYVYTLSTPDQGAVTSGSPTQLACAVTLRTGFRDHWGRFYVPASATQIGGAGLFGPLFVDAMANHVANSLEQLQSTRGIVPVVYDRNRKTAFSVTSISVDNVPDIIRRRRPPAQTYRKIIEE